MTNIVNIASPPSSGLPHYYRTRQQHNLVVCVWLIFVTTVYAWAAILLLPLILMILSSLPLYQARRGGTDSPDFRLFWDVATFGIIVPSPIYTFFSVARMWEAYRDHHHTKAIAVSLIPALTFAVFVYTASNYTTH